MKKKKIAFLLAATMIVANMAPIAASDFSDGSAVEAGAEFGQPEVVSVEEAFVDAEEETSLFSDFVESQEEGVPIMEEDYGVEEAAAVEGEMYTINFEGEIILDQTQEFVRLLNIEREKLGVPPVQIDQKMMEKAIRRAPEAAVYFAHIDPETGQETNMTYSVSAECISLRYKKDASVFIEGLRNSPAHWGILTDRDCIRFGAAICRTEDNYYFVSCQVGTNWGSFEEYSGNYFNEEKRFTQNIKANFRGNLHPGIPVYTPLNVGSTESPKLFMRNKMVGKVYRLLSITPSGYWESLTPNTVSVDQNGNVTGLAPGYGIIRYCMSNGSDEYSEFLFEVSGSSESTIKKPYTPKVTGTVSGYTNAKLNWTKTSNTKGYQIYKYNNETQKYQRIKTLKGSSSTTYTDNLGYGKTAQYKVRAYNKNSAGKTVYGNFSSLLTVKTATGTPSLTKVSNSSKGKLKLTWKKTSGADGYVIYRKVGKNGSYKKIKTITSGKTVSYTNGNLKKGTAYYYKIRAYRKGADGKNIYSRWSKVLGSTCR